MASDQESTSVLQKLSDANIEDRTENPFYESESEQENDNKFTKRVQKKNDGVSVPLPLTTGLRKGDVVQVEVVGPGVLILKKMQPTQIIVKETMKESAIELVEKILDSFGLKKHFKDYKTEEKSG